jgi:alpha-tubulin suppressor-like RCC1 family protein
LDEFGTLVIEDDDKVKRKLVDREVLYAVPQGNTKLYFILKDSVVFKSAYSWNTVTIFEGEVSEVIAGEAHAFLKTSEGLYYATGANNYTQYAMVHAQTDEETTLLTTLNKLPIKQVYCGGWHCYAKLTDGTFLGWGYNQVSCVKLQYQHHRMVGLEMADLTPFVLPHP